MWNNPMTKKIRGRPKLHKSFAGMLRMNSELKEFLMAEKQPNETMSECNLRLLRSKGKKVAALLQERDYLNRNVDRLQKRIDEMLPLVVEVKDMKEWGVIRRK